jgi:hypothetical protein
VLLELSFEYRIKRIDELEVTKIKNFAKKFCEFRARWFEKTQMDWFGSDNVEWMQIKIAWRET